MLNFLTAIHKGDLLSKSTIFKEQPQNAKIAPHMDKRIWKLMSPQAKETDKFLSKQQLEHNIQLRKELSSYRSLLDYLPNRFQLTGPPWHIHTIKEGYYPVLHLTPPINISSLDQYHIVPPELAGEIQKLLDK
ncbi:46277_t:CDS:2 [Gigaspora margarita]|uniref:46277_t:CDS:1 n=1 Tax=Gigaspora margarita TaxID=4874 RepID=A0ABN7V5X8_GIGMA|nr:46277_t:CDS:2 [Gigaspora margarita]